jgi:hypothetical protein
MSNKNNTPTIATHSSARNVEERAEELKNSTFPNFGRAALLVTESLQTAKIIAQQVFRDNPYSAIPFTARDVLEINKYLIDMDLTLERSLMLRRAQDEMLKHQAEAASTPTFVNPMPIKDKPS